ncbi:MAG TPA: hypothetical protein VKQ30_15915 [Ktedonobacterales bacterium]|jgi:hypothetical protein|nr:hypothetical protein [Ktedonobacterales bacterium]
MLGGLLWVLVVVACWVTIASIIIFLIRFAAREVDDEQVVCDLTPDYFADHPAAT